MRSFKPTRRTVLGGLLSLPWAKAKASVTLTGAGSAGGIIPGTAATTFAIAASVQYHPNSQTATLDGSNKVTACTDLKGLADASSSSGPVQMTDALGRKFWRFNGTEWLAVANTLTAVANRSFMCLMVVRVHHARSTVNLVNPRFSAYTNATTNTAANSSIGYMRATVTSASAPFLQAGSPAASTNATDCYKVIPGAQLQVLAVASRVTASGGTRLYLNNDTCDVAQQTTSVTGYIGALIGGAPGASNSEAVTTSVNNVFDLYEFAFWNASVSNTNSDAAVAAAVTNYGITQLDTNLVLEGDSITDGIATSLSTSPAWSGGIGSALTQPGAMLVGNNVRVLNLGTSGNQTSNLVTKRDATSSIFSSGKYPGGASKNIVAVQIGRNDVSQTGGQKNSAMLYSDVVALINTTSTGYLQRGWSVVQVSNIAAPTTAVTTNVSPVTEVTIQKRIEGFRALIMSGTSILPQFQTDTASAAGNTYDGLVSVLPVSEITVSGSTAFKTAADALNTGAGYFDSDNTHLRVAGINLMASGGDNAAYGYGALA